MNTKNFALAVTLAATAFLAGCGNRNDDCVNGKHANGTVCSSSSGGSSGGGLFRSKSGGFGGSHGGESGGS